MTFTIPKPNFAGTTIDDPSLLLAKEWLVTNGMGGYASSSLLGIATRRYHGLFVPDLPGRGRTMIIPRLDDTVEQGSVMALLSGAEYADGRIEMEGDPVFEDITREWQTPVWKFDVNGAVLEKRVVAPHGQNTVYIQYRLVNGPPVRLHLRPYVTYRMHDARLGEGQAGSFTMTIRNEHYEIALPEGTPSLKLCLRPAGGVFVVDQLTSEGVSYRVDRDRGSEHIQDLFSPGHFTVDLSAGQQTALVASVEPWELLEFTCDDILQAEQRRLETMASLAPELQREDLTRQLQLAAEQFIVLPGARAEEQALAHAAGDEARTIIAGYHWFGDWGRDTMISLEGLTLCTGRHHETRSILRTFARYFRDGLIPNLFPEGARQALYHTADATLWYFHALDRYLSATKDRDTLHLPLSHLERRGAPPSGWHAFQYRRGSARRASARGPGYVSTDMDGCKGG